MNKENSKPPSLNIPKGPVDYKGKNEDGSFNTEGVLSMKESEKEEGDPVLDMILSLKTFRENLDGTKRDLVVLTGNLDCEEIHDTIRSIKMARAWVGELLLLLGSTPYANDGKRRSVKDIEPLKEAGEANLVIDSTHNVYEQIIHFIDDTRERLKEAYDQSFTYENAMDKALVGTGNTSAISYSKFNLAKSAMFTHVREARINLGFALGLIRDIHSANANDTED